MGNLFNELVLYINKLEDVGQGIGGVLEVFSCGFSTEPSGLGHGGYDVC